MTESKWMENQNNNYWYMFSWCTWDVTFMWNDVDWIFNRFRSKQNIESINRKIQKYHATASWTIPATSKIEKKWEEKKDLDWSTRTKCCRNDRKERKKSRPAGSWNKPLSTAVCRFDKLAWWNAECLSLLVVELCCCFVIQQRCGWIWENMGTRGSELICTWTWWRTQDRGELMKRGGLELVAI